MYFNMEVPGKRTSSDEEVENVDHSGKLCEPCQSDNVDTPANGLCIECEDYMCDACFKQHLRAKSCRNHTLSGAIPSSGTCIRTNVRATKCKQHDGETVKYYCREHEAVGCGDCMISNHMACKPEFIKDLSANFPEHEEYRTLMVKIERLISEKTTFEKKIQENKNDNKLMLEKAFGDINQFRLDINKYLDKVEKDITRQVENVMKENETLLTKLQNDCTVLSAKLEEIKNMLNKELFKDNVLFIHTVECKSQINESEKAISDMKSRSIKNYEFVCDQQLRRAVTSEENLGTLTISSLEVFHKTAEEANEKNIDQLNAGNNAEGIYEREQFRTEDEGGYKGEEAGVRSVIAVGARVEHNKLGLWAGTVTAVHEDGTVTVKWDNGWLRLSDRFRVGAGFHDVTLIRS